MAIRGLKASPEGIKKAHQALIRNSLNKKALAGELGIARSTVQLFFKPQPVERFNFEEICTRLGLDWRDIIANPLTETETEEKEQSNPQFQDAEPEQIEETRLRKEILREQLKISIEQLRSILIMQMPTITGLMFAMN
jgi:DNA-binding Xre family transcriptional regulator